MTDTVSIFVPDETIIPIEELYELSGIESIVEETNSQGDTIGYYLTWPPAVENPAADDELPATKVQKIRLSLLTPEPEAEAEMLADYRQRVVNLLDGRTDKKAKKILRRADRMTRIIDCIVSPDWDERSEQLLYGIMEYYDYAHLVANGTIYNENANIEIGHANSKPKYFAEEVTVKDDISSEAAKRKKSSIKALKSQRIPYIAHLPVIADSEQTTLRDEEIVAWRAMALHAVVQRAEGEADPEFQQRIEKYQLAGKFSPEEQGFVDDDDPEDYMIIRMSQRMESYWLLLWALGYINELDQPITFCPIIQANQIIDSRTAHEFIADAALRSKKEILDAADLYYRYHWAVVDAELYGKNPPRGLKPVVIFERHYALNWLIGYRDQEWDFVTADT